MHNNKMRLNICRIIGNKAGISQLLQLGANVDETDKNNYTPLISAAINGM